MLLVGILGGMGRAGRRLSVYLRSAARHGRICRRHRMGSIIGGHHLGRSDGGGHGMRSTGGRGGAEDVREGSLPLVIGR